MTMRAGLGVRSLCVGTWQSLFLPLETEYIRFTPGKVANEHTPG